MMIKHPFPFGYLEQILKLPSYMRPGDGPHTYIPNAVFIILVRNVQKTAFVIFLVTICFSGFLYAAPGVSCFSIFSESAIMGAEKSFRTLPKRNSMHYLELVQNLRLQLQETNSYAILDLRTYISQLTGHLWANSFPKGVGSQISQGKILYNKGEKLVEEDPQQWQVEGIENLKIWLKELIGDAIPNISLGEGSVNVRKSTEDNQGLIFDEWHVDGGGASVTLAVDGLGTEKLGGAPMGLSVRQYHELRGKDWEAQCPGCQAMTVPTGYAFVFFGSSSGSQRQFEPTIHRTRKKAGSRTLFVVRY
jgi:hypothetical protein